MSVDNLLPGMAVVLIGTYVEHSEAGVNTPTACRTLSRSPRGVPDASRIRLEAIWTMLPFPCDVGTVLPPETVRIAQEGLSTFAEWRSWASLRTRRLVPDSAP